MVNTGPIVCASPSCRWRYGCTTGFLRAVACSRIKSLESHVSFILVCLNSTVPGTRVRGNTRRVQTSPKRGNRKGPTYAEAMPRGRRSTANNMMPVEIFFPKLDRVRESSCQRGDARDDSGPPKVEELPRYLWPDVARVFLDATALFNLSIPLLCLASSLLSACPARTSCAAGMRRRSKKALCLIDYPTPGLDNAASGREISEWKNQLALPYGNSRWPDGESWTVLSIPLKRRQGDRHAGAEAA